MSSLLKKSALLVGILITSLEAWGQGSSNITLLANINNYPSHRYTDCWGYTAPDGREYALLCVGHGTSIIDITETNNIHEVAFIPSIDTKDIKTYQHYAYGVNESGQGYGMVIIDLSGLPVTATLVSRYSGFPMSHNIYIDEANGLLYAQNKIGTNRPDAVRVLSLADPIRPVQLSQFNEIGCHDVYVRGNIAYVSEGSNHAIGIYDLTNPRTPTFVHRIRIPTNGFAHNAWLSDNGNFLMTTEETTNQTVKLWDIRDLGNTDITDQYLAPDGLAHNVLIKGNFAYIAHYWDGLRILDIANPSDIKEVAFYDTYPKPATNQFNGAWGVFPFFTSGKVLVSDIETGLYVLLFEGASEANQFIPRTPTNAAAFSDYRTPTSIFISWKDPQTYANGTPLTNFSIEIHRDNQFLFRVASGAENFTDTGLTDGQKYTYKIFAKAANNNVSAANTISAFAGGAPTPAPPEELFFTKDTQNNLILRWRNSSTNFDGTPMIDFAGIKIFEGAQFVAAFARQPADTGRLDSAIISQPLKSRRFTLTAFDDGAPVHESVASEPISSPQPLPFSDRFETQNIDPDIWTTFNALISPWSTDPPSPSFALHLDGWTDGGDVVESLPLDLTAGDSKITVSFWWQPSGRLGNTYSSDTLYVDFKNNLGQWVIVRAFAGANFKFFNREFIDVGAEAAGAGASFFHLNFRIRFRRSKLMGGGASTAGNFFIDDIFVAREGATEVADNNSSETIPKDFALLQNYPNPFNPFTTIEYHVPKNAEVELSIFDVHGSLIKTIVNGKQAAGKKRVTWGGTNALGQPVSSAVYFYRLKAGDYLQIKKMLLVK